MARLLVILALLCPAAFLYARCDMNEVIQDQQNPKVRKAVFAGSWYPGSRSRLADEVNGFMDKARDVSLEEPLRGLISPHAGYAYSGPTAAVGYKLLKGSGVKRVIVLALSHRYPLRGASIADVTHYETPMGLIPLDREACDAILADNRFSCVPGAHKAEHSLEIQLPFLQAALEEGFQIIPVVIGDVSSGDLEAMAKILIPYWDDETVVVASTDFTHYGASFGYVPFTDDIPKNLAELDGGAIDLIEAVDAKGFQKYVRKTGATICGRKPVALILRMAKIKGYGVHRLFYTTSGEITGDFSTSVSYASIAVTGESMEKGAAGSELSAAEQKTLLELARATLRSVVKTGKEPEDISGFDITDRLQENLGAFVTLKIAGRLRGCIGYLQGRGPLYRTVIQNTINAARNDPRFSPVQADEEPEIHIEISVLSPVVPVKDIEEIVVGRDGLIITHGMNRGTLLPQVPVEYGWDRTEFLEHTCAKAGLGKDAYKDPKTKIERYSAQVFGESE